MTFLLLYKYESDKPIAINVTNKSAPVNIPIVDIANRLSTIKVVSLKRLPDVFGNVEFVSNGVINAVVCLPIPDKSERAVLTGKLD